MCKISVCTLPDILTHLLFKMCMTIFQKSADVHKNLCGHLQFTSMPNLFCPKCPHKSATKKKQSEFYTSFCGRPQANLHRAADVRKKIAPADTEKCPQKSAGFDRGTDICGFVADICGHTPTSTMIYAEVRICPQHMPDLLLTLKVQVLHFQGQPRSTKVTCRFDLCN